MNRSGMSEGFIDVRGRLPTTLTILPTYKCTAACDNCCFGSHPGIDESVVGRIPYERIINYIDQAADIGTIRLVVFSGGESFLLKRAELDEAIAHATRRGMFTRCVTNGFWAITKERALKRLQSLKEAGLTELNLSTGDYHQRFVPPTNIVNGTLAAIELGIPTCIMVESRKGREFTTETLLSEDRLSKMIRDENFRNFFKIIESPWMPMSPRAEIPQNDEMYLTRENLHLRKGCDSVLTTIVVTPNEALGACCGLTREQIPELHVGSLKQHSMKVLYDVAIQDFLKIWLFIEGPEHIVAWAAEKEPSIEWEGRFAHTCDVCRFMYLNPKVRHVIREHYREKLYDVLLRFSILNQYDLPEICKVVNEAPAVSEILSTGAVIS